MTSITESNRQEPSEHLDVLVVGAGLSGIGAGHHLQSKTPWASYAIFESRGAIGGTWDLFRYPGIRSDSDMFTLGYSWRPWDGQKSIADGDDILRYIVETAKEEGIDEKIRFHHRIEAADWSSKDACWTVTARNTETDEIVLVTASFIFSCSGYYRYDHGYQPDFPGLDTFDGQVIHPQRWPEGLDYAGKKVVVIGSGATAITLVPSMAPEASSVTMLQRSPTYIVPQPAKDPLAQLLRFALPTSLSGPIIKWYKAIVTQGFYEVSRWRPEATKKALVGLTRSQLPDGYDVGKHFTPSYDPWDQRVCVVPNGDLFAALSDGTASVVTDHIETFTPSGIALESGEHLDADIVISATGLELLFIGGIEVSVDGEAVDVGSRVSYKGMMLEGVPNFAIGIGYTNASWTLKCDLIGDYVTRLLNHMHKSRTRQATPVDRHGSITAEPLFGLTSGYVRRGIDRMPKQGSRAPWIINQNYLKDFRAFRTARLDDGAMVFSNPGRFGAAPAPAPRTPAGV